MPGYAPGFFFSTTANRAYYDYLTTNTEAKASALSNAIDAMNATMDTAIAQRQAEGGDASALTGLKMRMEGALGGGLETRSVYTVADHTVDALIALPREALSNAEYDSLMSAYRMYEANSSDANAASVVAAGKQALDSINIAQLEQSGVLTQSQSRALAEVKAEIENIDSENGVGDNGNVKPSNPLHDAKAHTDANIRNLIEGEGQNVNEFAALLDADRVLTPKEKALIRRVLQKIGTPKKGTEMQKVIPEKDIQKILQGKYKTVRKSVAQASHMSKLITLAEVLYGLRLDYPNSDFSFKDNSYGRIKYIVEDESSISYSIDEAGYAWPYTGRGFIGTDRVIVPEYMQTEVEYLDGSIFEIVDSRTGEVLETYKFNLDIKQWILKGGK